MANSVRLQGYGKSYLWLMGMDGERNVWLHNAWIKRIQCNPSGRDLLVVHAQCPEPAKYLYPFPDGSTLELLAPEGYRGDFYRKGDIIVQFADCKLIQARQLNVNVGEEARATLRLYVSCTVQFDWQLHEEK